jgi:outer membrane protein assembly factor BamB
MSTVKKSFLIVTALTISSWIALGQNRNWPTYGGDAQRTGFQAAEPRITPATVKDLQLLWKIKLEVQSRGMRPLMPPVILGRLISYRGFRELAFVGANSDIVYSLDADLGTLFWQKHLEYSTRDPQVTTSSWRCPGGLTAMPTMPAPAPRGGAAGRGGPVPAAPGQRGSASAFIGGPASVYAISSDGRLHRLNTSTGDDITQPVSVLPANARATTLNMVDNVIYTMTTHGCNDVTNAVWAIDLNVDPPKTRSFELKAGGNWGLGGPVIGSDGTVYVQTGDGRAELSNALLALTPRELQLKEYFSSPVTSGQAAGSSDISNVASPVVFASGNRDVIAAVCSDDRLCLLDSASLGGSDHTKPMHQTPSLFQSTRDAQNLVERGIWGNLSTWQDTDGTRWVLAPVNGPIHPDLKAAVTNGPASNGFIAAFKVREQGGQTTLEPAWVSRDLSSPLPPVIANGVIFALSAGEFTRKVSESGDSVDEKPKSGTRATLYALDARTGKELYSSRNLVTGPAALSGLAVANGRVYFGGIDGTLYAFGMPMER